MDDMDVTQELVDDAMDLLAHETMPEVELQELLMTMGSSIDDVEYALFRNDPSPPPRRVRVYHDPPPSTPSDSPTEDETTYLSDEKLRRLRHMR